VIVWVSPTAIFKLLMEKSADFPEKHANGKK